MVLLDHLGSVYILEKDLASVVKSSLFGGASFKRSAARSNDRVDAAILPAKSNQVDISSSVAVAAIQLPRSAGQRRLSAASGYFL